MYLLNVYSIVKEQVRGFCPSSGRSRERAKIKSPEKFLKNFFTGSSFEHSSLEYRKTKKAQLAEMRVTYLDQALKAGLTAATITAIMQLVPELYKAIDYLIKHGEIDLNQLKKSGGKVILTSGDDGNCAKKIK